MSGFLLDDFEANDPQYSKVCTYCRYITGYRKCAAFRYIPDDIWLGKNDHTQPYPGDHGILFEPNGGKR